MFSPLHTPCINAHERSIDSTSIFRTEKQQRAFYYARRLEEYCFFLRLHSDHVWKGIFDNASIDRISEIFFLVVLYLSNAKKSRKIRYMDQFRYTDRSESLVLIKIPLDQSEVNS